MTKRIGWIVGLLGFLALLAWSAHGLSNSRTRQLVGDLVTGVETVDSVVALTFDDGPIPTFTDSVLATLSELDVPATFFMVGRAIQANPGIADRVVAAGHELANHSFSHRRMVLMWPWQIGREIEDTDALIRAAGHRGPIFVRPPFGKRLLGLPLHLKRHGRPVVLWDLEPDTYHRDAEGVVAYVNERVRPGSIILLHVEVSSRTENRAALPRIIADLRSRGYRFVTLSELMARGSPP
jgi:peptidoglycan/xylan/chitin deacetylase (PgdA/CDA1 family)